MSEGRGVATGAKVGAGILGVLGVVIARGGDDCAMAGMRAGSHVPPGSAAGLSDDLARAGGGLGDDLAYGGRYGGGLGDDLGGVGSANRLGALGASVDDGARPAGDLFEAGLDVTFEVVTLDLGEDEDGDQLAYAERSIDPAGTTELAVVDPRLREIWLQIAARDPTLIVATPSSGYDAGAIRATLARAGESTPIGIVGVTGDGGETIRLGDTEVATKDLHLDCLEARRACVVFACPDDACVGAATAAFEAAAAESRRAVVLRSTFERGLVTARGVTPALRSAVISRLSLPALARGGFRGEPAVVVSRAR